jgi:C4-dicarboxylate-specific signal transduction histidine kinase
MEKSGKKYLYIIAIFVVLLLGMYLWKVIAVNNVQKKIEAQRIEVIEKSQQIIAEKTRYFLRLTTTPLVWAIRKEILKENYEQINEYLSLFVKESQIKQILVVKSDGMVVAATDKKLEGFSFPSQYPKEYLEKNAIFITDDKDGRIVIISPIMGLSKKLGTFLMTYEPEKINIEMTQQK